MLQGPRPFTPRRSKSHGLPLVVRATGIPPELPPRTTVKLKIAEIDSEKRFIALSYLNAVV